MQADSPLVGHCRPSPNLRPRGDGDEVRVVVIHGTWMADDEAALARLCDPAAEVSCHYYIARDGAITQLVREADVAWHAGQSTWRGREGVNGFSLGIEIGNSGASEPYTEAAYRSLLALLADLAARYPQVGIVGHEHISPGRKDDPGIHFDWQRLRDAGLPVAV